MQEPPRPSLPNPNPNPAPAAADVTADILTPATTRRDTLEVKARSLAALLAADRKQAELSHPWFSSELSETAVEQWDGAQLDPRAVLSASAAALAAAEVLLLLLVLS